MREIIYSMLAAASLAIGPATFANEPVVSDPAADADCLIALMILLDEADETDEDAIATIAMYYFGRLGGEGYANEAYLISRMGRFADNENLYLTESQSCATDFETETKKFENLAKILGD